MLEHRIVWQALKLKMYFNKRLQNKGPTERRYRNEIKNHLSMVTVAVHDRVQKQAREVLYAFLFDKQQIHQFHQKSMLMLHRIMSI